MNKDYEIWLQRARASAPPEGQAVVDWLLQHLGADEVAALCQTCGVEFVSVLPQERRPLKAGESNYLLQWPDGREALLQLDPWDEQAAQRAAAELGRYVEPIAASMQGLRPGHGVERPKAGVKPGSGDGVVGFVDSAILLAYQEGASDLHFECDRQGVQVKLRLDGVMSPGPQRGGVQFAEEVISRIKVLAQLDITERRLPQDGRFRFEQPGVAIDLRVSIMPSVHGEDAVLRLLDKSHLRSQDQQIHLGALGFDDQAARQIRHLASLPNGMLLVTGPTGSGKTTTVYAAMSEIHTGREKIITIEDPVEYELPGVLQIPVNERKGLSFARGLRSILRHDPDRILVGEIRDAETAGIAVQSALTGHLVFTTVHANSLFDVVGRFRHFGIDMFGFTSALNGVVAQRLMRRLCSQCSDRRAPTPEERDWLERQGSTLAQLPLAVGCPHCHGSGYRGRFVVAEVHRIQDGFRDLVVRNVDLSELKAMAFGPDLGVRPLVQLALDAVERGETSLEELFRVVGQV